MLTHGVVTPNHLHFEHINLALDTGWPVFAEKPIVRTAGETLALAYRLAAGNTPPLFIGLESVVAGHEHSSMSVITGQMPASLDNATLPTTAGFLYSVYISGAGLSTMLNLALSPSGPTVGPIAARPATAGLHTTDLLWDFSKNALLMNLAKRSATCRRAFGQSARHAMKASLRTH